MRGSLDAATQTFRESDVGLVDAGNAFMCQQSLWDDLHRRVQFAWVAVSGDGWDGAQTIPRTIDVSAKAGRLLFNAHPNVWGLHGARADVPLATLATGQQQDLTSLIQGLGGSGGLQLHLRVEVTVPLVASADISVEISILGGHGHGGTTLVVTPSGAASAPLPNCSACVNKPRSSAAQASARSSPALRPIHHARQSVPPAWPWPPAPPRPHTPPFRVRREPVALFWDAADAGAVPAAFGSLGLPLLTSTAQVADQQQLGLGRGRLCGHHPDPVRPEPDRPGRRQEVPGAVSDTA